ncbi:MAG: sugar ABC transporter ATP-binding protein, partial [Mesorhizobium sp.]
PRRDAAKQGTVCMFQELSLMPHLSVGDNIVLAAPRTRMGLVERGVYREAREALDLVGATSIPLGARVSGLSLSERQLVEIAKAVFRKPKLLILDEATSALTSELVETVFGVLRMLKAQGVAILFISHRMHEVYAIADRISVFRNGRHIETFDVGARTTDQIVGLMIGRSLQELFPPRR